jgi:hypothetical protein
MGLFVRAVALVATVSLVPVLAIAQSPAAPPSAPSGSSVAPAEPAGASAAPSPKPVVPATGYSFGALGAAAPAPRPARAHPGAARAPPPGADATMAGFETRSDGSTRLFVELSKPALYDTKPGPSSVTYVLKGVRVDRRNNQNPLVTVHFNTPMTSARLMPRGRDLWLVVDLRANVRPTTTMDAVDGGSAILRVDFAKGEYLPAPSEAASVAEPNPPAVEAANAAPSATSAPHAAR